MIRGCSSTRPTIRLVTGVELLVLGAAAGVTAALTAVAGAGGGMILLVVMLQFADPLVAIPAHGMIQLCSNGTRAISLRHDIDRPLLVPFVVPLLPCTVAGYLIADAIPRTSGRAIIGGFALLAVWWPTATRRLAPAPDRGTRFAGVGVVAGLLNPTVGAAGPLLAPAFRAAASSHVVFVATFAVAQVLGHVTKVTVFAFAGYSWSEHLAMIAVGIVGVVVGTRVGARWLRRLEPAPLDRLFRLVVTVGALRLLLGWWV